jgi:hypothetical protein
MSQCVRVRRGWLVAAAVMAVVAGTACGSSGPTNPGLTAAELVGTYDLASLTLDNDPPLVPPEATGTLTLALSTYNVTLNLPNGTQVDSGTWSVSGSTWTQSSSTQAIQEQGTASLSHDTLTVNLNAAGTQISSVWVKQP